MTFVLGLLGANAFWLLFVWMLSAIAASYLSERKGYGDKPGLATGLLLTVIGPVIWLVRAGQGRLPLEAPGSVSGRA